MAHHRLGHPSEARHWLDRTHAMFDQLFEVAAADPFDPTLPSHGQMDPLATYVLYREARTLMGVSSPAEHPLPWLLQARAHACLGQPDEARTCFDKTIALRPDSPAAWRARGLFRVRRGEVAAAVADFAALNRFSDCTLADKHRYAVLCLATGDVDGYRATCKELTARVALSKEADASQRVALLCALSPESGVELSHLLRLAGVGGSAEESPLPRMARGAAQYRLNQAADAVKHLQEAVRLASSQQDGRPLETATAYLLLGLAQARLGATNEAHRCLGQAVTLLDQDIPSPATGDHGRGAFDGLACRVLHREAEQVLAGAARR
jgi:tetratricopeptide (TPR) repeat protein